MDISKELERLEQAEKLRSGAKFFSFKNVGDAIEGSLVGRYFSVSPLGQKQIVYTLKTKDGVSNVGLNVKLGFIHEALKNAVVGQAVKFSFIGEKPNPIKGYHAIKQIRVLTEDGLIDDSISPWLTENGLVLGKPLPSVEELSEEGSGEEVETEEESSAKPFGAGLPKSTK